MLQGFWHPAQRALTAGYVERYFADIRPLWDRRPGEVAKNAVQYLFPPVVELRTVQAADAWLAEEDHPGAAAPAGRRGPRRDRPVPARPGAGRRRE
jgi:aminopeptidase N